MVEAAGVEPSRRNFFNRLMATSISSDSSGQVVGLVLHESRTQTDGTPHTCVTTPLPVEPRIPPR